MALNQPTERRNDATRNIDVVSTVEAIESILREDATATAVTMTAAPALAQYETLLPFKPG